MSHTPGPWILFEHENEREFYFDAGRVQLLTTLTSENGLEEMKANARLIAAAPEMLAALELVTAWMEASGEGLDDIFDPCMAAIRRAKGE